MANNCKIHKNSKGEVTSVEVDQVIRPDIVHEIEEQTSTGTIINNTDVRIEDLKQFFDNEEFAILTAENPNNVLQTAERNAELNQQLEEYLNERGINFTRVEGMYSGKKEASYLIPGMTSQQALEIAREFNQESILHTLGYVYQDGTYNPRTGEDVYGDVGSDNYSIINGHKFSLGIDFNTSLQVPQYTNKNGAFQTFFSNVVGGNEKYKPLKEWAPRVVFNKVQEKFYAAFEKFRGNFDNHIATSIPTFRELQVLTGNAVSEMFSSNGRNTTPELLSVKEKYMEENGLTGKPVYSKVNKELFKEISSYHDTVEDDRSNKEMSESYTAFLEETKKQYEALIEAGYKIEPWMGEGEPYGVDSNLLRKDIIENKHLYYLRSRAATGENNEQESGDTYMPFKDAGFKINGQEVLLNDLFRAVHDIMGHGMVHNTFSTQGEFDAYNTHAPMYSKKAQKALFLETVVYNAFYSQNKKYAPRKIYNIPNDWMNNISGRRVLDIGGSEGGWVKAITEATNNKVQTVNLDPNPGMVKSFNATPVENSNMEVKTFYEEFGEFEIYEPKVKYDVVHEAMTFQFISSEREAYIDEINSKYLKEDGLVIFEEKFQLTDKAQQEANEQAKDRYKEEFYTKEEINDKKGKVLGDMGNMQANREQFEALLKEKYKYVEQHWDGGNFGGFIASNSKQTIDSFLEKMGGPLVADIYNKVTADQSTDIGNQLSVVTDLSGNQTEVDSNSIVTYESEAGPIRYITDSNGDMQMVRLEEQTVPQGAQAFGTSDPVMDFAMQYASESELLRDTDGNVIGVRPEVLEEIRKEREQIETEARANGTWMKAPNGENTNLNEDQWVDVRTKRFKDWFGDWLNDPQNASKVVDENGEPLVVYHGSRMNTFSVFSQSDLEDGGYWYSSSFNVAATYAGGSIQLLRGVDPRQTGRFEGRKAKDVILEDGPEGFAQSAERAESEVIDIIYNSRRELQDNGIVDDIDYQDAVDFFYENASIEFRIMEYDSRNGNSIIYGELNPIEYASEYESAQESGADKGTANDSGVPFNAVDTEISVELTIGDKVYEGYGDSVQTAIENLFSNAKEDGIEGFDIINRGKPADNVSGVRAMFLNMRNPLDKDGKGANWNKIDGNKTTRDIVKEEFDNGGDSVIIRNIHDIASEAMENNTISDVYIVREPNQIKSATDNIGTYSTTDNNINFQVAEGEDFSPASTEKLTAISEFLGKTNLAESVTMLNNEEVLDMVKHVKGEESYKELGIEGGKIKGFTYQGNIYLNTEAATLDTPLHEFGHLYNKWLKENRREIYNRGIQLVQQEIENPTSEIKDTIDFVRAAQPSLTGEALAEEILTELMGKKGLEALNSKKKKGPILEWLEQVWDEIKGILGLSQYTTEEILGMNLNDYTEAAATDLMRGRPMVEMFSNKILGNNSTRIEVTYIEESRRKELEEQGIIRVEKDLTFMRGAQVVTTSPDDMVVGTVSISDTDGKNITTIRSTEGTGGLYFITKFKEVWAFKAKGRATSIAREINKARAENGGRTYFLLVKGSDDKLLSNPQGITNTLNITTALMDAGLVTKSDMREAVTEALKAHEAVIDIPLNASIVEIKENISSFFKDEKKITFEKRGDAVKQLVGNLNKTKSFKKNRKEIAKFLGVDPKQFTKAADVRNAVALISAEGRLVGLNSGDIYAAVEINHDVAVVEGDHEVFEASIVEIDENGNKVQPKLILIDGSHSGYTEMQFNDGRKFEDFPANKVTKAFNNNVLGKNTFSWGRGIIREDTKPSTEYYTGKVIYSAIFTNKEELIERYTPQHSNVYAHHSTIEFRPKQVLQKDIGTIHQLKVTGRLVTDKVDVLLVDNPRSANEYPHITLAVAEGVKPFESNAEIAQNLDQVQPLDDTIDGVFGVFDGKTDVTMNSVRFSIQPEEDSGTLRYGDSTLEYGPRYSPITGARTGETELKNIKTPEASRGQGMARKLMEMFIEKMDDEGRTAYLMISPGDVNTSADRLAGLYKEYGFREKSGMFIGEMTRRPKTRTVRKTSETAKEFIKQPFLTQEESLGAYANIYDSVDEWENLNCR